MDQKSHHQNYNNINFHIAGTPYQHAASFNQVPTISRQHQSQCQQVPSTQQVLQQQGPMQYGGAGSHHINQQLQYQLGQGRHPSPVAQQQQQQQQQQQNMSLQQQASYEHMFHAQTAANKEPQLHNVPQESQQTVPSKDKEIDNLRAAHLEEVSKLHDRIMQLEREKDEKEKLYERIQRRVRNDQQNVVTQQTVVPESDEDAAAAAADEQSFCSSPGARSNSPVSSIKEEPVENPPHSEGELTPKETIPEKSEDIGKEEAPEIELISHKKYQTFLSNFTLCIICQEMQDEKLIMLPRDIIKSFHRVVVNRNDKRCQILKDELRNHESFLDNLPQYHPTCKNNFRIHNKKKKKTQKETLPKVTDFTLCIVCQDNTGEKLLNMTERGFPTIQFAVLHREDAIAKRLKVSVESQDTFLSFKPKLHVVCRRYANRNVILRKIKAAEKKRELKEKDENETEPTISGENLLQLLKEKNQLKENSAAVPLDTSSFDFETNCFICKHKKPRIGNRNIKYITKEKYDKLINKAEALGDENMLLITKSTDHPENKLQHHIYCLSSYYNRKITKVNYNNLPYDIAFTHLVKRIEEPIFLEGKAFDIIDLRDEYKHYLSEQGISSTLKSCKMMDKLSKYFTVPDPVSKYHSNCAIKISKHGLKYNIIHSIHLTEDETNAEVERLNRRRKRIAEEGQSNQENEEEGESDADENQEMGTKLLGENVIGSGKHANIKINQIFTKYNRGKIEKKPKELKFICTECGFRCAHKGALWGHMKKHANGDVLTSTLCEKCGKSFKNKKACALHLLTHGERKFSCTLCDKKFYTNDTLKDHEIIHTGDKKFKCTICDSKFLKSYYLTKHMRTHSEERPFACKLCDYSCKDKTRLNEHMIKHSDINPYVCDYCGKSYKYRSVFRHHKFTHTGKPHKCNKCEFTSYTKVSLRKHMESHDDGAVFKNQVSEYTPSKKKSIVKTSKNFRDIVNDSDSDSSNTTPSPSPSAPQALSEPLTSTSPSNTCPTATNSTTPFVYFPTGTLPQYYVLNCEDIKFK